MVKIESMLCGLFNNIKTIQSHKKPHRTYNINKIAHSK